MIERLNAVLSSPNNIRAIPGLKASAERALGLLNGIATARLKVGQGLDAVSAAPRGDLVRPRRFEIAAILGRLRA